MSSLLYRLGHWAVRRRGRVAVAWVLLLVLAGLGAVTLNTGTDDTFSIPGTESGDALDRLQLTFPQVSGTTATYLVVAPEGHDVHDSAFSNPIDTLVHDLTATDGVDAVSDPYGTHVDGLISPDNRAAIIQVQLEGQSITVSDDTKDTLIGFESDLASAVPNGTQVTVGGELFSRELPTVGISEAFGVVVALVVLLLTLGSFVAAGLPILTALLGVGLSTAAIFLATAVATVSSTTPLIALMLGLAVGIDYALFIISRHRAELREGQTPEEAIARSLATAGSAVVFAGLTVMIALAGLAIGQIPFLTTMGVAAAFAVGVAVLISLTLTPALLGFAGERMRPRPRRPRAAAEPPSATPAHTEHLNGSFYARWVRAATRHSVVTIAAIVVLLGVIALPAAKLELALPDAGSLPADNEARQTYDLIADHFGPGWNGPLIVTGTIIGSNDPLTLMSDLADEIAQLDGVAAVPLSTPNPTADTGIIQVIPESGPDSMETKALVNEIRAQHDHYLATYGVDLAVSGFTAVAIDISSRLGNALLPFGVVVVGLSLVLLTMLFRSLWVPITAALGYLLSIGASFGIVVSVFQFGWGASLFGIDRPGPVMSFMPILLMGVLFGLAMDYEVFLVSRMREDYVHGGDAREAVRTGFVHSAVVVTAAAAIMFSVFAAFVPEGDANIKPVALGLAVGIFIDAYIVRMTLIPAVMHLLGERAWHFPHRLDRALPSFDVEGEGLAAELALADWPEPGHRDAVAAQGLYLDGPDGSFYRNVSVRVPKASTLVMVGGHRSGRTALLLTFAGRVHPDGGRLKVDGLVSPVRAAAVRGRVAVARLARTTNQVAEVNAAVESGAPIIAIDDLDTVSDPGDRRAVASRLVVARQRGATLLITCLDQSLVTDLLPPGATANLHTDANTTAEVR